MKHYRLIDTVVIALAVLKRTTASIDHLVPEDSGIVHLGSLAWNLLMMFDFVWTVSSFGYMIKPGS